MARAKKSVTMYRNLKKYGEQNLDREKAVKRLAEYLKETLTSKIHDPHTTNKEMDFLLIRWHGNVIEENEESVETKVLYFVGVEGTSRIDYRDKLQVALQFTNGYDDILLYEDYEKSKEYVPYEQYRVQYRYILKQSGFGDFREDMIRAVTTNQSNVIEAHISEEEPEIMLHELMVKTPTT